jgi:hypothetical protein
MRSNVVPINIFLAKPNATYEYGEDHVYNATGPVHMGGDCGGEADEFCGFPHVPGVVPKVFDWGEFYGD